MRAAEPVEAAAFDPRQLLRVLSAVKNGDFTARVPVRGSRTSREVAEALNDIVSLNERITNEFARLAAAVGKDGRTGDRASVAGAKGSWRAKIDSVNALVADLAQPTTEMGRVIGAVAKGDLSQKVALKVDGRALRGEFLRTAKLVNEMVEQLGSFASEVTRVAREVGTEGELGGQAVVRGVDGTWKDLTDNVNSMASNLTTQVRNIAEVTTAVAKGDLSKKITVNVKGEILELKNTINTMVDQLGSFASEVTRVAREVGTEGKLGGQAVVRGVGGTWKDLTDNVNSMASNLTTQVRNIASVTTAVAKGDLSKKIEVDARGEILELKDTINTMVDQLSSFASEVTRVAREVGTEGKLGGQAVVRGVGGTWKDLTDNVNSMATNLTTQVRGIAKVVTYVANGDLKRKLVLDVKGEIAELADTINGMIDTLAVFADQVTTVAREVGIEGKLGGQARVPGTAGIWRDLTDNVNQLAANLTTQVRAIADVATAVTKGDLTRSITVDAQGEVAALKDNINEMIRNLKDTTRKNTEQDWLKTNLAKFTRMLQGERVLSTVSKLILSELAPLIEAQYGAFYISERTDEQDTLKLIAGYAYQPRDGVPSDFKFGEGLVGQCAVDKERILITDAPAEYVRVSSALGAAGAPNIVVLPVLFEGGIKAVIELASFRRFSEVNLDFVKQLTESIGVVLNTIAANMRTELLLQQSQALTEELTEINKRLEQQKTEVEHKNSEVEQAKRALEEKAKQLALTSKYKSEFLANMSHELRTPLNSLLLLSQTLSENPEGNLSTRQVEFARTIHASGSDLLELINDILDLAKIESGTVAVNVGKVQFPAMRDFVDRSFRQVAEKKGLDFRVELAGELPDRIETDGKRLQQILRNLLSNACKFTDRGQVILRMAAAPSGWSSDHAILRSARSVIAFSVRDTGIGIPKEKHQLIFEAFQQADGTTSRKYGGTGLGLSISRELAQLLGGEIRLESESGRGSTFTLYLPLDYAGSSTRSTASEANGPWKDSGPEVPVIDEWGKVGLWAERVDRGRPSPVPLEKAILVVTEKPEWVAAVQQASKQSNLGVVVADSAEATLELVKQVSPLGVLLDVGLPRREGWLLLDRLKHDAELRHVPVCVIGAAEQRASALTRGALLHLEVGAEVGAEREGAARAIEKIRGFSERATRSVLLVDADATLPAQLGELLDASGVTLESVPTMASAVATLGARPFDCLVVHLGEADAAHLEGLSGIPAGTPVIVYSADGVQRPKLRALAERDVIKEAHTPERLLEEASLFLHRPLSTFGEPAAQLLRKSLERGAELAGRKVLVVDDDVRNIFALTSLLERQGMKVLFAENARDGIGVLEETPDVEVVLMDVMMPELDGYQAMRMIRSMVRYADLPIVALTAKAMKGDREKCIAAGASDYIAKPVNVDKLLSLLRVWLSGRPNVAVGPAVGPPEVTAAELR
jgi:signal transduction histidine kinase/HAMP domain-containing protein/DNA-binding response OmpR family regulator